MLLLLKKLNFHEKSGQFRTQILSIVDRSTALLSEPLYFIKENGPNLESDLLTDDL